MPPSHYASFFQIPPDMPYHVITAVVVLIWLYPSKTPDLFDKELNHARISFFILLWVVKMSKGLMSILLLHHFDLLWRTTGKQQMCTKQWVCCAGRVSLQILRVYVKAMGGYWAFLLLMSWFILIEAARVGTTVWLSQWTSSVDAPGGAAHKAMWYLGIYAAISGAQVYYLHCLTLLSSNFSRCIKGFENSIVFRQCLSSGAYVEFFNASVPLDIQFLCVSWAVWKRYR